MYSHNSSIKVHGKLLVRPITPSPLQNMMHTTPLPPFRICPKIREERQESTDMEIDVCECSIDLHSITSMYNVSLHKYYLLKSIETELHEGINGQF